MNDENILYEALKTWFSLNNLNKRNFTSQNKVANLLKIELSKQNRWKNKGGGPRIPPNSAGAAADALTENASVPADAQDYEDDEDENNEIKQEKQAREQQIIKSIKKQYDLKLMAGFLSANIKDPFYIIDEGKKVQIDYLGGGVYREDIEEIKDIVKNSRAEFMNDF